MEIITQDKLFRYRGDDSCPICFEELNNTYVWAHEDVDRLGYDHPIHVDCRDEILSRSRVIYQCSICRIRLTGHNTQIQEPYDPTIKILHSYTEGQAPEVLSKYFQSRKLTLFENSFRHGISMDSSCFIASLIFLFYLNNWSWPTNIPAHRENNPIVHVATDIVRIVPLLMRLLANLIDPSYAESSSTEFELHRVLAKVHRQEMRNCHIAGLVLGILASMIPTVYLTTSEETFMPTLLSFLIPPIGMGICSLVAFKLCDIEN